MSADRKAVLDAALELPDEDRAEIAQRLLDSLPEDSEATVPISNIWIEEAEARVREIRDGSTETIPHEEVIQEIDRRFQVDHSDSPS